jgi:hypothetical protein
VPRPDLHVAEVERRWLHARVGLDLKTWGNAYHVSKTKKGKDTTTRTWNTGTDCVFSLSKGSYKIAATGDSLTLTNATTTFQLERTPAVKDVDTAAEAKQLASE